MKWPFAVSICTRILKYRVWKIEFDELDFLSISNLNFAGYTGSKNLVQTWQKFQFIKLDFSNLIFQNPSADRYRDGFALFALLFSIGFKLFETHDYPLFCQIFFSVFVYLFIIEICPTFGQFCLLIWKNEKTRVICKVGTFESLQYIYPVLSVIKNGFFDAKFERNSTLNMCHTNPRLQRKYEILKMARNRKTLYCGLSFFLCVHGHTLGYLCDCEKIQELIWRFWNSWSW